MAASPDAAPQAEYWLARLAADGGQPFEAYDRLRAYFAGSSDDAGGGYGLGDGLGAEPYELLAVVLTAVNDRASLTADLRRLAGRGRPHAVAAYAEALEQQGDGEQAEQLMRGLLSQASGKGPVSTGLADTQSTTSGIRLDGAELELDGAQIDDALGLRVAAWLTRRLTAERRLADLSLLLPSIAAATSDYEELSPLIAEAAEDKRQATRFAQRLAGWSLQGRSAEELACGAWAAGAAGLPAEATRLHRAAVLADLKLDREQAARRCLSWAGDLLADDRYRRAAEAIAWGQQQELWPAGDATPFFYLATSLSLAGEHDRALEAARAAAQREPDSAGTATRVAWVLYNADRLDDAVTVYRQVVEDFDEDPDAGAKDALRDARLTLSFIASDRGDAAAAAERLLQVLDEFPADANAQNDLAYLWAVRGERPRRCLRLAQAAVDAEPDNDAYLDTLAWAQHKLGNHAEALATIDRALEIAQGQGAEPDGEVLD
ncbi:MAG: tetratricopeptide repeat protein, partial [Planctomycetota bacterium]